MNIPIISLIGQPNVGKSSLFNALVGKNTAIVSAQAGVTRDRQFAHLSLDNKPVWLVDTAGIAKDDEKLSQAMYEQSRQAANDASVVLLVVDGSKMCTPMDISLAREIQKSKTNMILIINKQDIATDVCINSYLKLGISEVLHVSATTKHGLPNLIHQLTKILPNTPPYTPSTHPTITIVGKPNAGKSTLTNHYAKEDRCIVSNIPGTTRDAIAIELAHKGTPYELIDTAGLRRKAKINEEIEQYATAITLRAIEKSKVVIHLVDATDHIARQDFRIIHLCLNMGKSVIIGVNKTDCLNLSAKKHFRENLNIALNHLKNIPIIEISATQGRNTQTLMKQAISQAKAMDQTFNTSKLTRVLEKLVKTTPPPTRLGRPINLRMAHVSRQHPLEITIKGKRTDYLPKSYIRYLNNGFLRELSLTGRQVKLKLVSDHNPYV